MTQIKYDINAGDDERWSGGGLTMAGGTKFTAKRRFILISGEWILAFLHFGRKSLRSDAFWKVMRGMPTAMDGHAKDADGYGRSCSEWHAGHPKL